ncbi:unnamed protein product [Linum trigynum]|uniref:Uncharacterized protein n=1 Tax=Linum trigynum TaxID=586398 RepID=A0AAV2DGG2_9ROSI
MRKRVKEIEEMRELEKKAEEWRWRIQSQRSGDGGSNFLAQSGEQRSGDGGLAVAGSEKGEWGRRGVGESEGGAAAAGDCCGRIPLCCISADCGRRRMAGEFAMVRVRRRQTHHTYGGVLGRVRMRRLVGLTGDYLRRLSG